MTKKELSEKTKEKLRKRIKQGDTQQNEKDSSEGNSKEKNLRKIILERDNFTCKYCGRREYTFKRSLHMHHIDYNHENNDVNNLITLCSRCHRNTNLNRAFWEKYLKSLIDKKDKNDIE